MPRSWLSLAAAALAAAALVASPAPAQPAGDRPLAEQPYLGLSVRDTPDGPVVGWVMPGPLGGTGYDSAAGIRRSDNLVSINGEPTASAAAFNDAIAALGPGDQVTIAIRRSPEAQPQAAVPKGGPGGGELTFTATLASRDEWTGTIGRGLGERAIPDAAKGEFEDLILARAAELGVREGGEGIGGGLDPLLAHLRDVQEQALDPNSLPAVVNAFRRPLSLDAVERPLADAARRAATDSGLALDVLHLALDLPRFRASHDDVHPVLERIHAARAAWVERVDQQGPARLLARHMRDDYSIRGDRTAEMIRILRHAGRQAGDLLLWHLDRLPWLMAEVERRLAPHAGGTALPELPDRVRRAVEGDVLYFEERGGRALLVVGGPGPNTYNMGEINWVYDSGGSDLYRFTASEGEPLVKERAIVDVAGNDRYESQDDFAGPAVGTFAIGLIDDHAGNDTYTSKEGGTQFSIAAGLFGIGLLIDRDGDDTYTNLGPGSGWSMGVGFYGAGLIIDQGGNDTYHGEKLVQGVGGPRGFGAIIDAAGDDAYKANGPNFGSAYGTEGVYLGMSQGFGYGIRSYAAGGVGAIYDLAGDDAYEAGEFSQAGGYYFGLGILHDFAGNDRYTGNRYGQAFAAHQAAGILIDDMGDDTYWSMTAASQAGTWDESVGMLIDRAGNDSYTADGLAQGSAAMQAIAILLDLAGDDQYTAKGAATQGQGGNNTYHYEASKIFSFSALFDLGGGADTYSSGRDNGTQQRTGEHNPETPAESSLHGLFVDE